MWKKKQTNKTKQKKINLPKQSLEQDKMDSNVPRFVSTKLTLCLITTLRYQGMINKNKSKQGLNIIQNLSSNGIVVMGQNYRYFKPSFTQYPIIVQASNKDTDETIEPIKSNKRPICSKTYKTNWSLLRTLPNIYGVFLAKMGFSLSLTLRQVWKSTRVDAKKVTAW